MRWWQPWEGMRPCGVGSVPTPQIRSSMWHGLLPPSPMSRAGTTFVVVHGNGPQVGMLAGQGQFEPPAIAAICEKELKATSLAVGVRHCRDG